MNSNIPDDFGKQKEIAKQVCMNSLFHTCKYLLGFKDINWRTHGDMLLALEELEFRQQGHANALIAMPRGSL
jgi:uncharacterized protein (UPF0332 family)